MPTREDDLSTRQVCTSDKDRLKHNKPLLALKLNNLQCARSQRSLPLLQSMSRAPDYNLSTRGSRALCDRDKQGCTLKHFDSRQVIYQEKPTTDVSEMPSHAQGNKYKLPINYELRIRV